VTSYKPTSRYYLLDEWIGGLPLIAEVVASQLAKTTSERAWQYIENRFQRQALRALRIRKTPAEVAALAEAGAAIDRVHASVPQWLRLGGPSGRPRPTSPVPARAAGHARIDFVIVGSGPNAAKPHHEPTSRVLREGDAVVVDIGGTMPSGYCSDCTRTYAIGAGPPDMARYYEVLREAQEAACAAVRPGIPAQAVDAVARDAIAAAGHGEHFTHRTGHGIGLETHEDP